MVVLVTVFFFLLVLFEPARPYGTQTITLRLAQLNLLATQNNETKRIRYY